MVHWTIHHCIYGGGLGNWGLGVCGVGDGAATGGFEWRCRDIFDI